MHLTIGQKVINKWQRAGFAFASYSDQWTQHPRIIRHFRYRSKLVRLSVALALTAAFWYPLARLLPQTAFQIVIVAVLIIFGLSSILARNIPARLIVLGATASVALLLDGLLRGSPEFGPALLASLIGSFLSFALGLTCGSRSTNFTNIIRSVIATYFLVIILEILLTASNSIASLERIGPRPAAAGVVLAIILLGLSSLPRPVELTIVIIGLVLVLVTYSRMAFFVGLLVIAIRVVFSHLRLIPKLALGLLSLPALLFVSFAWFANRGGDPWRSDEISFSMDASETAAVISVPVNSTGRNLFWPAVLDSAIQNPVFGSGLGSSSDLIERVFPTIEHPHNDYLKVFHDLGAVGLLLFFVVLLYPILIVAKSTRWFTNRPRRHEVVAVQLSVFMMSMSLTDNLLSYIWILWPWSAALGITLQLGKSRGS